MTQLYMFVRQVRCTAKLSLVSHLLKILPAIARGDVLTQVFMERCLQRAVWHKTIHRFRSHSFLWQSTQEDAMNAVSAIAHKTRERWYGGMISVLCPSQSLSLLLSYLSRVPLTFSWIHHRNHPHLPQNLQDQVLVMYSLSHQGALVLKRGHSSFIFKSILCRLTTGWKIQGNCQLRC